MGRPGQGCLNLDKKVYKSMDRKAVARETLDIMKQGYYDMADSSEKRDGIRGKRIWIQEDMERSVTRSILITPEQGREILDRYDGRGRGEGAAGIKQVAERRADAGRVENISTVDAIGRLAAEGKKNIGVLNFASAKNPGGGFLNGAMAQEESLAASSTLYRTLTANEEYYQVNRANRSMMYTDYGIYSPEVTFFRDGRFRLVEKPVKASVLTMPAVNMGQVIQKGEDLQEAKKVMRHRMRLVLAVFAEQGAKNLVLGAYGCGVFRNDPLQVAAWWKEILEEGFSQYFESIYYAVLDSSKSQKCIGAFRQIFMEEYDSPEGQLRP